MPDDKLSSRIACNTQWTRLSISLMPNFAFSFHKIHTLRQLSSLHGYHALCACAMKCIYLTANKTDVVRIVENWLGEASTKESKRTKARIKLHSKVMWHSYWNADECGINKNTLFIHILVYTSPSLFHFALNWTQNMNGWSAQMTFYCIYPLIYV